MTDPLSAQGTVQADGVMMRRLEGPEIAVFDLGADGAAGGAGANPDVELTSGLDDRFDDNVEDDLMFGLLRPGVRKTAFDGESLDEYSSDVCFGSNDESW